MKKFENEEFQKRLAEILVDNEDIEIATDVLLEDESDSDAESDEEDDDFMDLVIRCYSSVAITITVDEEEIKKEIEKYESLKKHEQRVFELFMMVWRFIEELEEERKKEREQEGPDLD